MDGHASNVQPFHGYVLSGRGSMPDVLLKFCSPPQGVHSTSWSPKVWKHALKLQIKLVASCNLEANIRQGSMSGLGTVSLSGRGRPTSGHWRRVRPLEGRVRLGTPSLSRTWIAAWCLPLSCNLQQVLFAICKWFLFENWTYVPIISYWFQRLVRQGPAYIVRRSSTHIRCLWLKCLWYLPNVMWNCHMLT